MTSPFHHTARKRFGQNFLHDLGIISKIVNSVAPTPGDNIVEIGPGKGAITELLLARCPKLNVVELDRDLVPFLLASFAKYPEFKLHQADALKFDFSSLASAAEPLRIVGNLPYNISTPLIFYLLRLGPLVKDMHFMLQKEVVERMAADPGSKAYGKLSVMTQYFCNVQSLFLVPPECFVPRPKVESAVVRLEPYSDFPVVASDVSVLEKVVNSAFQQRRKTLRNALKQWCDGAQLEALGIDPNARPESLTVADFVSIANACHVNEH